ncbi:hypothetical protein FUAX_08690 [Fulvitalea axinellae]|uniref:TonB-dependent receptor n=1 Tax=Fulvitalea axinellae TaxID=1182444 RepID=A0AAU9CSR8_9BACT|nr:hypothetical protein FUAX_08690 [Fulvitalea axinellae]
MSCLKYALSFLSVLAFGFASAQKIHFRDQKTGESIPGVAVGFRTEKGMGQCIISGPDGNANWLGDHGHIKLETSHISYEPIFFRFSGNDTTVYLTPKSLQLDEVVVTGQFSPQSSRNSVYRVKTIGAERIEKSGSQSLEQLLRTQLNIRFAQDGATGQASLQFMGMSGQYVKVLVDGVPMAGRSGTDNAIDLNQINLDEIERVEIIEGPMAVNFGVDALAGVVNLITKTSSANKVEAGVNISEESAGDQYGKDQGLHRQNAYASYRISDKISARASFGHYKFGGFSANEDNRTKEWLPKEQWYGSGTLNYSDKQWDAHYRFDFMDQTIDNPGEWGPEKAEDRKYDTKRLSHQLQAAYRFGHDFSTHWSAAYTDYERKTLTYNVDKATGKKTLSLNDKPQDDTYDAVNVIAQFFYKKGIAKIQGGYAYSHEKAGGTKLSAPEAISDHAFFATAELSFGKLAVKPGLRYAINSIYDAPVTPQLHLKYALNDEISLRAEYGRGFRAPSVRELYYTFVDSNHNIYGNPDLKAETSDHFGLATDFRKKLGDFTLRTDLSAFYNDVHDKIGLKYEDNASGPPISTFKNFDSYRTYGFTLSQRTLYKNTELAVAYGLTSVSLLSESEFTETGEITASLTQNFPKIGLSASFFLKRTGRTPYIGSEKVTGTDGEESTVEVVKYFDPFEWLDFTISKNFFKGNLTTTAGVKNLLDVTTTNQGESSGGAHGSNAGRNVGYGRSYFVTLGYRFSKK